MIKNLLVSVIIPTYNEELSIKDCISTLLFQIYKPIELIIIDDGSTDSTISKVKSFSSIKILQQNHQGPGAARNFGAKNAKGEILVFVDADMTFDKDFIEKLTQPIREGKVIGTFSKEEFVANKDNIWAKCWSINRGWPKDRMHPKDYPNEQPVFRAILKKEFERVGGFDPIGYTDDWTLSRKLGVLAQVAPRAIFYHKNPETFSEIWSQARWIGKNEFITGSLIRKLWSLWVYGPINSLRKAILVSMTKKTPQFFLFKLWYDLAILTSVIKSFIGERKTK